MTDPTKLVQRFEAKLLEQLRESEAENIMLRKQLAQRDTEKVSFARFVRDQLAQHHDQWERVRQTIDSLHALMPRTVGDWRRCAYPPCSNWFEVSREQNGRTKRARFCTDSHRALASRLSRGRRTSPEKKDQ